MLNLRNQYFLSLSSHFSLYHIRCYCTSIAPIDKGSNTSNEPPMETYESLYAKNIPKLRAQATAHKINLKSERKKEKIIQIMLAHYKSVNAVTASKPPKFFTRALANTNLILSIGTDGSTLINVSVWFEGEFKKRDLQRKIATKRFQHILKRYCELFGGTVDSILRFTNWNGSDALFLPPILALSLASITNIEIEFQCLLYLLHTQPQELRYYHSLEVSELRKQLDVVGISSRSVTWVEFNAPYAYYWFIIDYTVKCGAVGVKKQKNDNELDESNDKNLEARLATHRSTYSRLKLLNAVLFNNSTAVTSFENYMKSVLKPWNIGTIQNLEQYESDCKTSDVVIELIRQKVDYAVKPMIEASEAIYCDADLITKYNKVVDERHTQ